MRHFIALAAFPVLLACGDPAAHIPRLSETDVSEDAPVLGVVPKVDVNEPAPGGLFSRLFGSDRPQPKNVDLDATPSVDAAVAEQSSTPETLPPESYGVATKLPEKSAEKRGIFALFGAGGSEIDETGRTASLGSNDALSEPAKRAALFGNAKRATSEITPGTRLPYGRVARICDLPKLSMGKKIDQYPEKRSQHVLYDSDPGNTAPHTFYLTGFADGCARQFTASVAVFGSVGMHEQLRYGLPAEVQPYSDTDKAYEKLKSKVCNVPRKKPCGAKVSKLENDTVFLSIYERYGGNARWSNLLLHSGQVLAQDIKGL